MVPKYDMLHIKPSYDCILKITAKFKILISCKICHKKVQTHPLPKNPILNSIPSIHAPHLFHHPQANIFTSSIFFIYHIFQFFFHSIDDIRWQSIASYTFCPCPVTLIMYIKDKRICEINFKKIKIIELKNHTDNNVIYSFFWFTTVAITSSVQTRKKEIVIFH